MPQDIVIVGEAVSGERAEVQKALKKCIKLLNTSTFDIAELLFKAKSKHLYTEPTFADFVKTLDIKPRRAQYLETLAEVMSAANITRAEYEPIGVTKLRVITRLDPAATYTNPDTNVAEPMVDYIVGLVELATQHPEKTADDLEQSVRVLMGETGDNDMTWLNIRLLRLTKENIVDKAFEKAAINIGSVATDAEGVEQDASDGRKLEIICAEYLTDAHSNPEMTGE
jgi:hypothetical protein